jgi:hypothetical protein
VTRTDRTTRDTATATADAEPHGRFAYPDRNDPRREAIILDTATEFVGCLLNCTAEQAAPALKLVADADMPTALDQHALKLIRDLVARNIAPTAAGVLARAFTTGTASDQLHREQLTGYLIDAMANTRWPANVEWMAGVVLELAYRRAWVTYCTRVTQQAEQGSLAGLERAAADREHLRDLWRRLKEAHGGEFLDDAAVMTPSVGVA